MFTFESSNSEEIYNMKSKIKATAFGSKYKSNTNIESSVNTNKAMSSLQIQIFGFGLGLDKDGSETLVATVRLELFVSNR